MAWPSREALFLILACAILAALALGRLMRTRPCSRSHRLNDEPAVEERLVLEVKPLGKLDVRNEDVGQVWWPAARHQHVPVGESGPMACAPDQGREQLVKALIGHVFEYVAHVVAIDPKPWLGR